MSPLEADSGEEVADFPRVSGDEPYDTAAAARVIEFSPRERG